MSTLQESIKQENKLSLLSFDGSIDAYKHILFLGNWVMLLGLVITIVTVMICYVYDEYFSFTIQTLSHIAMLLAVTSIKIGYIMRCIGRQGLGVKVL